MSTLAGRVALVTGGGRGIGRATALALAAAGSRVAVLARTRAEVVAVAREVDGVPLVADVTDAEAVRRAVAETAGTLGPVEVLVANAGVVWPVGPFAAVDPAEWERAVEVNLFGVVRCIRAVLPGMRRARWGRIVTLTSGAADRPGMTPASAYSVGKAGVAMLTANLAVELAGSGVTLNAVRPGTADTGMQDYLRSLPAAEVGERFHARFHGLHESGGLLDPDLGARLIVRLAASAQTGLSVDVRSPEGQAWLADRE